MSQGNSIALKLIFTMVFICIGMMFGVSSMADYSITFRDIPWLSSEAQVIQALKEQNAIPNNTDIDSLRRDQITVWEPFAGCEYSDGVKISDFSSKLGYDRVPQTDYVFRGTYSYLEKEGKPICQVAGYDVNIIRIVFLPKVKEQSDNTKTYDTLDLSFVRAGYVLDNLSYGKDEDVYRDLQEKLISLYGEPLEKNAVGWQGTIWHSLDGTGIYLWQFDNSVYLNYAYIDDKSMAAELNDIQHTLDDAAKSNTDGL